MVVKGRFRWLVLLLLPLALLVSGCDEKKGKDKTETSEAKERTLRLGALRISYAGSWNHMYPDPMGSMYPLYSALLHRDRENGALLPGDWTERFGLSDDKKTVTITLKKDAHFHDGSPVTAQSVVNSYRRTLKYDNGTRRPRDVQVDALDEKTIRLKGEVGGDAVMVASESVYYKTGSSESIDTPPPLRCGRFGSIGSGPYVVVSCDSNSMHYARWKEFPFRTYFDEVIVTLYDNQEAMAIDLLRNKIDVMLPSTTSAFESLAKSSFLGTKSVYGEPCSFVLQMHDAKDLADRNVREGISLLIDREAIIRHALPSALPYSAGSWPAPWLLTPAEKERHLKSSYNPVEGFHKLAVAGWHRVNGRLLNKSGQQLSLRVVVSPTTKFIPLMASALVSKLSEAGLAVESEYLEEIPMSEVIPDNDANNATLGMSCRYLDRLDIKVNVRENLYSWQDYYRATAPDGHEIRAIGEHLLAHPELPLNSSNSQYMRFIELYAKHSIYVVIAPFMGDVIWNRSTLGPLEEEYLKDPWALESLYRYRAPSDKP